MEEKNSKTLNGAGFAFSLPFDISNSPTQNRGLQIIEQEKNFYC
jgi:hypothetical protein